MLQLFISMLERLGLFAILFILLMRFELFSRLLTGKASRREKLGLAIFFGLMGVASTYMGVPINNAIANSRVVGVALGGVLGGPLVGFGAGLIAGSHRFLIDVGGFTATACGVATIVEGVAGGLFYRHLKRKPFDWFAALLTGLAVEVLQMLIILAVAKPFDEAVRLVAIIGLPMILVNAFGLALFVELVASVVHQKERFAAVQAQTALQVALRTMPFLRGGLTPATAAETTKIIKQMTDLDAVAITDQHQILAHCGAEELHHLPGTPLLTESTREALASGTISTPLTRTEIGCRHPGCQLGSAIIVPLKKNQQVIGALKLYRIKENGITPLDMELAEGLAHLFSYQLEISELDEQRKLVREAEIKALQSQINPHFLFNAINTVISYIRTSPATASELLVTLADFFRRNIQTGCSKVSLATELEHCEAYITLERARFEERLKVTYSVDDAVRTCSLPPLILQPLVENALRHGILTREEGGEVAISAFREAQQVIITVRDNGVGISPERLERLLDTDTPEPDTVDRTGGIGLKNVHARLIALYGHDHGLRIWSRPGEGTSVAMTIPFEVSPCR